MGRPTLCPDRTQGRLLGVENRWALHRDLLCTLFRFCSSFLSNAIPNHCVQGWAAGDVSLAAYIQAAVKDKDFGKPFLPSMSEAFMTWLVSGMTGVSALGAVMVSISLPAFSRASYSV